MVELVARSPIPVAPPETVVDGWAVSGRRTLAALTLTDSTPLAKVAVRADPGGELLGTRFGRAVRATWDGYDVLLVGSGPGEWLVLAPPGCAGDVIHRLTAASYNGHVSAVDLTHGRALLRLTGDRAADLLAMETSLDLADDFYPDGAALRCDLAGLAVDVVRDDRDGRRSYLLHCERSSGRYLAVALLDSGRELGLEVDGFRAPYP